MKSADGGFDRHRASRPRLGFWGRCADDFKLHAVGVGEGDHALVETIDDRLSFDAKLFKTLDPEIDSSRRYCKCGDRHLRRADLSAIGAGPGEKSHDRSGAT